MRFLRRLLAAGLSTATAVSASSLSSHSLSSVFYSSKIPTAAEIPTLTSSQFTLALAHRLGLSMFYTLDEADIDAVLKAEVVDPVAELFGGSGKGNIVVHIGGVDREFWEDIKPVFNVASQSARIDKIILEQAEEVMGFKLQPTWVCDDDAETNDRIEVMSRNYVCSSLLAVCHPKLIMSSGLYCFRFHKMGQFTGGRHYRPSRAQSPGPIRPQESQTQSFSH